MARDTSKNRNVRTSQKKGKDYDQSDIEHLLRVSEWSSWAEIVDWLRREGDSDSKLTPSEVEYMVDDFERLQRQGEPYTDDPQQMYARAHGGR